MAWNAIPRVARSAGRLRISAAAVAVVALAAVGCHSLDVANPNDPDLKRALATGGDIQSLLGGAFNKWYQSLAYNGGFSSVNGAAVMLAVASDHYESAWGNWGMKLMGWEPRNYEMTNSHTDASDNFRNDIEVPWYFNYGALVSANLVITALNNGVKIPGPIDSSANPMILAAARFMQGAALSNIALAFDSGYAFDETYDPTGPALPLVGRDSVQRAALTKLDQAIALASGANPAWKIPTTFLNQGSGAWTNTQLAQVANYWAARTIAYFPHNVTENGQADWARVLSYASKGISSGVPFDMTVTGDGGNNWWGDYIGIADALFDWMRVSERTVCLFDPSFPCHHANDDRQDSVPQTADWRFNGDGVVGDNCVPQVVAEAVAGVDGPPPAPYGGSYGAHCSTANKLGVADFFYADDQYGPTWTGFPASRGYWRYSNVSHVRYFDIGWDAPNTALGTLPFVLSAENDLLWAEALVRTGGSFVTAANLINNTRVGRGHLPALTGGETAQQLLDAIVYEKAIELFAADPMVDWFDARRLAPDLSPTYNVNLGDNFLTGWLPYGQGLQPGSPRLLPVPQQELTLIGHDVYTYGGPSWPEPAVGARPIKGIFGTTADGRVILGPGKWATIADAMIAEGAHRNGSIRFRR
jgi:hypothetical protein